MISLETLRNFVQTNTGYITEVSVFEGHIKDILTQPYLYVAPVLTKLGATQEVVDGGYFANTTHLPIALKLNIQILTTVDTFHTVWKNVYNGLSGQKLSSNNVDEIFSGLIYEEGFLQAITTNKILWVDKWSYTIHVI